MSSRYSPQLVCSSSAASGSYDRVRASSSPQGAGVGGASEELEEAIVPDCFEEAGASGRREVIGRKGNKRGAEEGGHKS